MANRKKKSVDGKVVLISILTVLLVAVLVVSFGLGSAASGKWFKNADIKTWFNNWGKGKKAEDKTPRLIAVDGDNNAMYSYTTYEMPSEIAFFSNSENDIKAELTLTVEFNADFAEYITEPLLFSVSWSAFIDEEYGNAYDYVNLTQTDNVALVTVEVLEAFESPITLTARLSDNTDIETSCQLNFVQRYYINEEDNAGTYNFAKFNAAGVDDKIELEGFYVTGGTAYGEFGGVISIELYNKFINRFKSHLTFEVEVINRVKCEMRVTENETGVIGVLKDHVSLSTFINGFADFSEEQQQAIAYAWYTAFSEDSLHGNADFIAALEYKYQDAVISRHYVRFLEVDLTGYNDYKKLNVDLVLNGSYVV